MPSIKKPANTKFDLILLGDPASGKATHGRVLTKHFKLYNLDMGHELRTLARKDPENPVFAKTLHKGKLTPTTIVQKILADKIVNSKSKRILFNGTPKMFSEARLVAKLLKQARPEGSKLFVIYLTVSKAEMLKRVLRRREKVGKHHFHRNDDTKKALENRFKYYKENIASVVEFLKTRYPFAVISTDAAEAVVNQKIFDKINEFINQD